MIFQSYTPTFILEPKNIKKIQKRALTNPNIRCYTKNQPRKKRNAFEKR